MSSMSSTSALGRDLEIGATWAAGGVLVVLLWLLLITGQVNILCAVVVAIPLLTLAVVKREAAVLWTLVYLVLLGDIRRVVAQIAAPGAFDPLLLVAPAVTVVLVIPVFANLRLADPLSKAVLGLLLVMVLEIVNPRQGPISVGLSGVFFYIVPLMWFWLGRSFGAPDLVRKIIYNVLLPLALMAGLIGICQTFIGFLPYQQAWISEVGRVYTSLYVGTSVRAFGFSTSAAEYATLLEFAISLAVAAFLASRRSWSLAIPILAGALLLSGGRGLTIKIVIALPVLWLVRRGQKITVVTIASMAVLASLALVSVSLIAGRFASSTEGQRGSSAAQEAMSHQMGGLAHPFDEKYSSAGLHSNMVTNGFLEGFTNPLGRGLGSTTFAAQKFGSDSDGGSSELDLSDMFIALGLVGGVLYFSVVVLGVRAAFRYVRTTPWQTGLPVFAILIATLGGWLIGGQYSTCSVVFFLLGCVVYPGTAANTALRQRSV